MREQLVAAVAAGRDDGGGREALGELRDRARPGLRRVARPSIVLGDVDGATPCAPSAPAASARAGAGDHGVDGSPPA